MDFQPGDIVEIVTPQEYRERGGRCTDDCAIAYYAGSTGRITNVYAAEGRAEISPITVVRNHHVDYTRDMTVADYRWHLRALKMHDEPVDPGFELAFDTVFQ